MATKYGFFNAVNSDRTYNAEDLTEYMMKIVNEGIAHDDDTSLQVTATSTLGTVNVLPGWAFVQSRYFAVTSTETVSGLTTVAGRTDLVVIRLDKNARNVTLQAVTNVGNSPTVQSYLTRTSTVWELALASVTLGSDGAYVITDLRGKTDAAGVYWCNWMYDLGTISQKADDVVSGMKHVKLTQAEYDEIETKDSDTVYFVLASDNKYHIYIGDVSSGGSGGGSSGSGSGVVSAASGVTFTSYVVDNNQGSNPLVPDVTFTTANGFNRCVANCQEICTFLNTHNDKIGFDSIVYDDTDGFLKCYVGDRVALKYSSIPNGGYTVIGSDGVEINVGTDTYNGYNQGFVGKNAIFLRYGWTSELGTPGTIYKYSFCIFTKTSDGEPLFVSLDPQSGDSSQYRTAVNLASTDAVMCHNSSYNPPMYWFGTTVGGSGQLDFVLGNSQAPSLQITPFGLILPRANMLDVLPSLTGYYGDYLTYLRDDVNEKAYFTIRNIVWEVPYETNYTGA